jgi:hypothetical protein
MDSGKAVSDLRIRPVINPDVTMKTNKIYKKARRRSGLISKAYHWFLDGLTPQEFLLKIMGIGLLVGLHHVVVAISHLP